MAWSRITPYAGVNELLRVRKLQQMYDSIEATVQPNEAVGVNIEGNVFGSYNQIDITSTSLIDISPEFSITMATSGRRVMVSAPLLYILNSITANVATAQIVTVVDGVTSTNSSLRIYSKATASDRATMGNSSYMHITAVLAAGLHTIKLQARIVTGTSAVLSVYYQPQMRLNVRDY